MSIQQEQIQIRLTTKQEQYAVSNAPIMVPVNFKRYGLSELVNNLLGREKPIPFEFLIDGEILRSTIASYLSSHRLSTENLITIEYMESMLPPTPLTSYQHDDWISSVQILENLFLTGSYDNMVRLWNTSGECTHTLIGHTEAIKSVTFGASTDSTVSVFSAGLDHTIIGWEINREESDEYQILYECCGHQAGIESLAMNLQKSHFATASSDSTIKVWSTETPVTSELVESTSQPQKKKKKTEKDNSKLIKTQAITLNGHVGAVNAVVFDDKDSNTVYSGGWDHSIRSWDIEQQVNTVTKNCEKVVLHTDYSSHSGLIATGHTDNILRLWDPRSEDGVNVKLALKGHSGFISSVSWAPNSSYSLCSGSYDGHIRVWDIRNNKGSVYTLNDPEQQKILDVDWNEGRIISGGESKKLGIFQAKTF